MAKNKLKKFAELEAMENVFEFPLQKILAGEKFYLRGNWANNFFANNNPIVLELGCGRGEYAVELAKRNPDKNFIGIDIKGARMWSGARITQREEMKNIAFIRTDIGNILSFFADSEIAEIWITFPDPQMKKLRKRLTSVNFLEKYQKILNNEGIIHLKTDSNFLFTYTSLLLEHNRISPKYQIFDVYKENNTSHYDILTSVKTYYETQWIERGIAIKYLQFQIQKAIELSEIDIEIPFDQYRSYGRHLRSQLKI